MSDEAVFSPESLAKLDSEALASRGWTLERQILAMHEKIEVLEKLRSMVEADTKRRGYREYNDFLNKYVSTSVVKKHTRAEDK